MRAILISSSGQKVLGQTPLMLGYAVDNHLVLLDAGVSGHHAEIRPDTQGAGYTISDLGSANGTFVNGQRLYPHMIYPLIPGAVIRVGNTTINYVTDDGTLQNGNSGYDTATFQASYNYQGASNPVHTGYGAADQSFTLIPPPPPIALDSPYTLLPEPPKKSRRKRLWIIPGALAVALLIGAICFIVINPFAPTPAKTVDSFCAGLQNRDYTGAYNLITADYQARYNEPTFKSYFSSVTSCTHNAVSAINGDTVSTVSLQPASVYPWTYQLTLVKDNSGNWKIDSFASAPDLMLDMFCSDVQNKQYMDTYNLTSLHYQGSVQESSFQSGLTSATSCSHTMTTGSNGVVSSIMTFGPSSAYLWSYEVSLIKDDSGAWRIDNFDALPDLVLDAFCTDLGSQNLTSAYSLTSTGYQNNVSESLFASNRSGAVSCTHTRASNSSGGVTATITYQMNDGTTARQTVTLIKDNNGNWKLDSFQNA